METNVEEQCPRCYFELLVSRGLVFYHAMVGQPYQLVREKDQKVEVGADTLVFMFPAVVCQVMSHAADPLWATTVLVCRG